MRPVKGSTFDGKFVGPKDTGPDEAATAGVVDVVDLVGSFVIMAVGIEVLAGMAVSVASTASCIVWSTTSVLVH